jgi:hypothetical protein
MRSKRVFVLLAAVLFLCSNCKKVDFHTPPKKYPADVAVAWMKLHIQLTLTTPNFNSVVSDRSFGYAGLTLYESIAAGVGEGESFLPLLNGAPILNAPKNRALFWPAAMNSAMALITKDLFGNASPAGLASIDSLEEVFNGQFQSSVGQADLKNATDYGRTVAAAIFEWSKADGGHEAYLHVTSPDYAPPVGDGLWIPTPPAFGPPIHPFWGRNRSFVPDIVGKTPQNPPTPYSTDVQSPFYAMVNELYTLSLSLSPTDSTTARIWADNLPGNLNVPAHATNILSQLVVLSHLDLESAARAYARHSMAMYDASISVFHTKYQYNLIRPISYIRNVMGHTTWNSVVPTPPHPEYTAAHAVISGASAAVLEGIFGKHYSFTDHTYDKGYGARTYSSFDDYAKEAAHARILGGLHYGPSLALGLAQGRKVGELELELSPGAQSSVMK